MIPLEQRVRNPVKIDVPGLCVRTLVDEVFCRRGVFVVPFRRGDFIPERGDLVAEILIINDQSVPIPLVCLRVKREGNRYWFGRIFRLVDFSEKVRREDEQVRLVDEQGREIPNTPEDRLAHILRMRVLPRNDAQKKQWAYWGDEYWVTAIFSELRRLKVQAVRAVASRR